MYFGFSQYILNLFMCKYFNLLCGIVSNCVDVLSSVVVYVVCGYNTWFLQMRFLLG